MAASTGASSFDFNLVAAIFGEGSALSRIVYIAFGISALWQLVPFMRSIGKGGSETYAQVVR